MKNHFFIAAILAFVAALVPTSANACASSHDLLKHVALLDRPAHSVGLPSAARKSVVTTHLVEATDGEALILTLDQKLQVKLLPSAHAAMTWEGAFRNPALGLEPGVVVEQSYDGGGNLITKVSVGWENPVQVIFLQQGETPLAKVLASKECKCTYVSFICTKKLCDDGGLCIGSDEDTCYLAAQTGQVLQSWQNLSPENDVIAALSGQ